MICRDVFGSERSGRFVDQQQFRILDKRPADADALALSAGQLIGALVGHVIEPDPRQQPECFVNVGLRKFPEEALPEPDGAKPPAQHVLHHREPFDQCVFLEDHAHPLPRAAQLAAAERVISTSLRVTVPAVGSTSRLMQRITVDLPAPDGPISAITWPSGTSRSMPLSATSPVR